jgi:hypothetical protein
MEKRVMEDYQDDLGGPASGATMSTTFLATFIALLAAAYLCFGI